MAILARRLALLVPFGVSLLISGLLAPAAGHGGDTTVIHACVANNGLVRIVGPNEPCQAQQAAIHWSIVGPQGPPGPSPANIGARVFSTARIPVPPDVEVELRFDGVRWDEGDLHNAAEPNRLTAPVPGKYLIFANVCYLPEDPYASDIRTRRRRSVLALNGRTFVLAMAYSPATLDNGNTCHVLTTVYELLVGDFVQVLATQHNDNFETIMVEGCGDGCDSSSHFGMLKLP